MTTHNGAAVGIVLEVASFRRIFSQKSQTRLHRVGVHNNPTSFVPNLQLAPLTWPSMSAVPSMHAAHRIFWVHYDNNDTVDTVGQEIVKTKASSPGCPGEASVSTAVLDSNRIECRGVEKSGGRRRTRTLLSGEVSEEIGKFSDFSAVVSVVQEVASESR